jgi:hypothetical protein
MKESRNSEEKDYKAIKRGVETPKISAKYN